jgi:hypothetical protein
VGQLIAALLLALVAYAWCAWSGAGIERPPGVLAPEDPHQELVKDGPTWEIGEYHVQGLARFEVSARVLSSERYRFDAGAKLAPVDLALGWGPMSANAVIDTLDISQGGRFYFWSSSEPMIEPGEINRHSANMHMVPLDAAARATLLAARRGNLVRLSGWLIEARTDEGWKWRSSLTRSDTGAGACELVLVESVALE